MHVRVAFHRLINKSKRKYLKEMSLPIDKNSLASMRVGFDQWPHPYAKSFASKQTIHKLNKSLSKYFTVKQIYWIVFVKIYWIVEHRVKSLFTAKIYLPLTSHSFLGNCRPRANDPVSRWPYYHLISNPQFNI